MTSRLYRVLIAASFWTLIRPFDDHQVAFVQTGDDLQYLDKYSSENLARSHIVEPSVELSKALLQLRFEPPALNFGERAIGIPILQKVTVTNPTTLKVRFDAISGSTVHFHCSFFEQKSVEPGASTTFDVVFLARTEGFIENVLFVHSSIGTFKFSVLGFGIQNPYRLRPFVGAKIPLNGTFSSDVEIHNPHPSTLKVLEMYTSGGHLHLELPSGESRMGKNIWEIPPFQTRTVMRARFLAVKEKNSTAYVKIKTNYSLQEPIVLPVEVEVSSAPGLYAAVDLIDFGFLKQQETSKPVALSVFNAANFSLEITAVSCEPSNSAITIDFAPLKISSNNRTPVEIGQLRFLAPHSPSVTHQFGYIHVRAAGDVYQLSIPYVVHFLEGKILFNTDPLSFHAEPKPSSEKSVRNVTLTSSFPFPVSVLNFTVNQTISPFIVAEPLASPAVLLPNVSEPVFQLKYLGSPEGISFTSFVHLSTNVTKLRIPVMIYSGKLRVTLYSLEEKHFDFGTMDSGDERSILFALTNENPLALTVLNLTRIQDSKLELLGIEEGNDTILAKDHQPTAYAWKSGQDFIIPANSFAVFRFTVVAPEKKSFYRSAVTIRTAFETHTVPVSFNVEDGAIIAVPDKIVFTDAFPGKISSQTLQLYSTFKSDMMVLRLSTLSHDPRIFFESFSKSEAPLVKPNTLTYLGRVVFFPIAGCMDDCYIGMPLNTDDGQRWVQGMSLPSTLPDIDAWLYGKLKLKWDSMKTNGEHIVNSTIVVDTTAVKGFSLPAQGHLSWPRLMKQSAVNFPLTALHNLTVLNLTLHNPSSLPVITQLIPLSLYPNAENLIALFESELPSPLTDLVEFDDVGLFTLRDSELFTLHESPVPKFRKSLEEVLGAQIPRYTLALTLQPGMKVRVRVGFQPKDYKLRSSLLLIRNNLTVVEIVSLYGQGGRSEVRLGGRLPFSSHPITIQVDEKKLKECENIKRLHYRLPSSLIERRSFVARNSGEVTVYVANISISGVQCQNRGFRVLNCESFSIKPNESHVIEIAFTPDFTMSWYEASVQLYMVGVAAPLVYSMAAQVPKEWLRRCQLALPRPYWEPLMYYSCVSALGFLLICVVASAYLEGDRIITCAMRQSKLVPPTSVFNLNSLPNDREMSILDETASKPLLVNGTADVSAVQQSSNTDDSSNMQSDKRPSKSMLGSLLQGFIVFVQRLRYRLMNSSATDPNVTEAVGKADRTDSSTPAWKDLHETAISPVNLNKPAHQTTKTPRKTSAKTVLGARSSADYVSTEEISVTVSSYRSNGSSEVVEMRKVNGVKQTHNTTTSRAKVAAAPSPTVKESQAEWTNGAAAKVVKTRSHPKPNHHSPRVRVDQESVEVSQSPTPHADSHETSNGVTELTSSIATVPLHDDYRDKSAKHTTDLDSGDVVNNRKGKRTAHAIASANHSDKESGLKAQKGGPDRKSSSDSSRKLSGEPTINQSEVANREETRRSEESDFGHNHLRNGSEIKTEAPVRKSPMSPLVIQTSGLKAGDESPVVPISSPFDLAARFTASVVNKTKKVSSYASESEDSVVPEWESSPLPAQNSEEAFNLFAEQSESFAKLMEPETKSFASAFTQVQPSKSWVAPRFQQKTLAVSPASNRGKVGPIQKPQTHISSSSRSSSTSSLDSSDISSPGSLEKPQNGGRKKKKPMSVAVGSPRRVSKTSPTRSRGKTLTKPKEIQQPTGNSSLWSSDFTSLNPIFGGFGSEDSFMPLKPSGMTMMQQLQAERRKKLEDFKQNKSMRGGGDEWPGFDLAPVSESLWDDEYDPWKPQGTAKTLWGSPSAISSSVAAAWDSATSPPGFYPPGAKITASRPPTDPGIVAWGAPLKPEQKGTGATGRVPQNAVKTDNRWKSSCSVDGESIPDLDVSWAESLLDDDVDN